jgi:hypothetical protein
MMQAMSERKAQEIKQTNAEFQAILKGAELPQKRTHGEAEKNGVTAEQSGTEI